MGLRIKELGIMVIFVAVCMVFSSSVFASGLKKTIAVAEFENRADYSGQVNLGSGMADQLTDALMQTGKFVVVERQILSDVI